MKRINMKKVVAGIATGLVIAIVAGIWFFGPMLGTMFLGKPIFVVTTPQRYANFAFDVAEMQGIYADTEEFQQTLQIAREEIKAVDSVADTYPIIEKVLKAAGGKHSNLLAPNENTPGVAEDTTMPTVTRDKGIATIVLPGVWSGPVGQQYADTAASGLAKETVDACGVIVDLRDNTGGDMGPMLAGVSSLLPNGTVLSFKSRANTSHVMIDGGSVTGGGTPITVASTSKFTGPVAVLVDKETASSGEATMLSFRGLENSKSFGQPTAGYASANIFIDMPDGAGLMLTTAKDVARTGEEFAEDPVQPDVVTDNPEDEAKAWLTQQCKVK